VILCKKQRNSIPYAMTDLAMNVVKEEHLPVEETDDSCIFKYIEVVPLDTHTDVSSTMSCASGDGICYGPVSVRLSVTRRCSTKTAKRRITQTTPYDSTGTLVFWCQRYPRNSTWVIPCGGDKCRCGGSKSATFDK